MAPAVLFAALVVSLGTSWSAAKADHDPCDSPRTSWETTHHPHKVRITRHERDGYEYYSGTAAEAIRFESDGEASVRISHPLDHASRVIDEFTAKVWYRSNRSGATFVVRVVLPHQIDPQTGKPVGFDVRGDVYTSVARWQQLVCRTGDSAVERQLRLVRSRLARLLQGQPVDVSDMHVTEVALIVPADRGPSELLIDEFKCGPIVRLDDVGNDIRPVAATSRQERPDPPIRIETNRILAHGKPIFGRIFPYHGENLDSLSELGANIVWIERYDNQILIEQLAERGMWSMAAPPRTDAGADSSSAEVGLMPIPASASSVAFWNVGTRVPVSQLRNVERWIDQIRDADRAYSRPRPVVADVVDEERRFSRHLSLLGSSRHVLHTTVSPLDYRDYLEHKLRLGLPGRVKWTLIQTEPADGNVVTRSTSDDKAVFVEAEQIWLQAWTAVSVGHKSIGFWRSPNSPPLDEGSPETIETRLALSLLNEQIDLLEPWLASGKVVGSVPVSVKLKQSPDLGRRAYGALNAATSRPEQRALLAQRDRELLRADRVQREVHAAVVDSTYGKLVIPVWYEDGAQFQPGQMAAQDVSLLVRQAGTFSRPWQVTTTSVKSLEYEVVAGGMLVKLPAIDQQAFIVITTDMRLEENLMQRIRMIRKRCGSLWVALARAKQERVAATHAQIERTGAPRIPDAHQLISSAAQMTEQAQKQLDAEQYDQAERYSRLALQQLRQLQRAHWENAVADLTAPTSSPHTVCFETLPDHWRMLDAVGRSPTGAGENLMRSGNFEDLDSMEVDGWHQVRTGGGDPELKIAELNTDAAQGQFCLRMRSTSALQSNKPPVSLSAGPEVVVVSPRVPVRGGQIVLISGRVRVDRVARGSVDGLLVYDNIKGTVGALRWKQVSPGGDWESFQMIREVPSTREVELRFELHCDGDVRFDNVQLVTLTTSLPGEQPTAESKERGFGRNLLDFAPSLPRVPFWPGRKPDESTRNPGRPSPN